MKHSLWIAIVSIITIASLIGAFYYFSASPPSSHIPDIQLDVNNLSALTNGQVSFNVTLHEGESGILESVLVNDTCYSWLDGSLKNGGTIQVVVKATRGISSANTTVEAPTSDGNNQNTPDYKYDYYGGVGLFKEGIHIFATSQDPRTLFGEFKIANDFWKMLLETETTRATNQDFISIILSRGDKPTGGYNIQIESFSWLESYPVKLRFHVNFTDPGEGVIVTEALTNPLVLVPIGKLTTGEYNIEVPIVQYILSIDKDGTPIYTQTMTFAPVIWKQTLTISKKEDPTPSTTFEVVLNGNEAPDLTVQVDLSNGLTGEEAKKIAEAAFIRTMGEKLHRIDTLIFDDNKITAHYTWGYDENDMGHVFDLTANLTTLRITINHCR